MHEMIEVTVYRTALYIHAVNTLLNGGFISNGRADKIRRLIYAAYLDALHEEGGEEIEPETDG